MKQPEALRLADWCDANSSGIYRPSAEAAAELRRQRAAIQELRGLLRRYVDQDRISGLTDNSLYHSARAALAKTEGA